VCNGSWLKQYQIYQLRFRNQYGLKLSVSSPDLAVWEDERVELSASETRASFLQASAAVISVPLIRNHGEQLLPFVPNSTRKEVPSLQCKWRMNMVPMPKTHTT